MDPIVAQCKSLLEAYKTGKLGQTIMPEDSKPDSFDNQESRLAYFTLPMSLNYQRDSYKLWEATLRTFNDPETKDVFDIKKASSIPAEILREKLLKHKLALQPNKHIQTWQTICQTTAKEWHGMAELFSVADNDLLRLKNIV